MALMSGGGGPPGGAPPDDAKEKETQNQNPLLAKRRATRESVSGDMVG
jgi:hypothetical protein